MEVVMKLFTTAFLRFFQIIFFNNFKQCSQTILKLFFLKQFQTFSIPSTKQHFASIQI